MPEEERDELILQKAQREIDHLRDLLDERYHTQTKAIDAAFTAQQTAMTTAHQAADKAVDKALEAAEKAVEKALAAAEKAVDQRTETLDREFREHLEQVRHENALAFLNADKAVSAALASAEKAVSKAESAAERRFESVNEFRAQLADQAGTFVTRAEAEVVNQRNAERITDLTDRINRSEGSSNGLRSGWVYLVGACAALAAIVSIVAAIAVFNA